MRSSTGSGGRTEVTTDQGKLYVVDTHTLVWFIEDNSRLSGSARAILKASDARIAVPVVTLAELAFLAEKGRISITLDRALEHIDGAPDCTICDMDRAVIQCMPTSLNIHDAMIVGTAIMCRDVLGERVALVTKDHEIAASGLVDVVW